MLILHLANDLLNLLINLLMKITLFSLCVLLNNGKLQLVTFASASTSATYCMQSVLLNIFASPSEVIDIQDYVLIMDIVVI